MHNYSYFGPLCYWISYSYCTYILDRWIAQLLRGRKEMICGSYESWSKFALGLKNTIQSCKFLSCFVIPYSTKHLRAKTFVVRSPCEYLWKNFHVYIKTTFKCQNTLKLVGKHSRFKQNHENHESFGPQLNILYYMVPCNCSPSAYTHPNILGVLSHIFIHLIFALILNQKLSTCWMRVPVMG